MLATAFAGNVTCILFQLFMQIKVIFFFMKDSMKRFYWKIQCVSIIACSTAMFDLY